MMADKDTFDQVYSGKTLVDRLKDDHFIDSFSYAVFLFSQDESINRETLRLLPVLRKRESISAFVLVYYDQNVLDIAKKEARFPYKSVSCSMDEAERIARYCTEISRECRKEERIVINGSFEKEDYRYRNVLGINGIGIEDVVAMTILFLRGIPSGEEIEEATLFRLPEYKRIRWDKKSSCLPKPDHGETDFPERVRDEIQKLLCDNVISKADEIILFSDTKSTRVLIEELSGYTIKAVLDNDISKSGNNIKGITIYHPDEIDNVDKDRRCKVIVPSRSYKRICEQLYASGYELGVNLFVTFKEVQQDSEAKATSEIEAWENRIRAGKEIYESIRKRYPDTRIYVCSYEGTGDAYLIGMYLRDRMKYDRVERCLLVTAANSTGRIIHLFNLDDCIDDTIVLNGREECDCLLTYIRQFGYDRADAAVLNNDYGLLYLLYLSGWKGIDFNTLFQRMIFHASERRVYADIRDRSSDEIFSQNQLTMGRTVLLSPHAHTPAFMLNDQIWEDIAHRLLAVGYDVCTNVNGEDEIPIKGTKGVFIPYNMLIDFMDKAGWFIGIRSGLCDIISGSKATKIILYPDTMFMYNTYYEYFSLAKMYDIKNDLTELTSKENEMETVERIVSRFSDRSMDD